MAKIYQLSQRYRIFIAHIWKYDVYYNTIVNWINDSEINWHKYSIPNEDPLIKGNSNILQKQMSPAKIVIVLSDHYYKYKFLIEHQIREAVKMNKILIGVKPCDYPTVPQILEDNATIMVDWGKESLIEAIKLYG